MRLAELRPACGALRSPLWTGSSKMKPIKRLHPFSQRHPPDRCHVTFSEQLLIAKANFDDSSGFSGGFLSVPHNLLAAEKEEAKAVLCLMLRKQGLSSAIVARTINKADLFIDHLISKLHSLHRTRYLVGRELTTLEIRDALVPYLESLFDEHGDVFVDAVENFPHPPGKKKPPSSSENFPHPPGKKKPPSSSARSAAGLDSMKQRAIARMTEQGSEGFSPTVLYLIDIGLSHDQIENITRKFPSFAYYNPDRKIKPLVEFLLELGVSREDIPAIIYKRPQLCGISLSENLMPMMTFLEGYGVDKNKWAKVIYQFPALLTYSRQKVKASVAYFCELGVSPKNIGKILTRCPQITSYSVDDKLRPTEEYFRSLGFDVATLIYRCPQSFGLSIDTNLKPVTEFFLEKGYTIEEIRTMVSRYGTLYAYSLEENIKPKWDFFLTMDYPKSELVKFPQFFGYSLEKRIKRRFKRLSECGVKLVLNQALSVSNSEFERILEKKLEKDNS